MGGIFIHKSLGGSFGGRMAVYQVPDVFDRWRDVSFFESGGITQSTFDWSELKNSLTGKTYYVDPVFGSNANSGLSWGSAFKSIAFALGHSDIRVMMLKPGLYSYSDSWQGVTPPNYLKVLVDGGASAVSSNKIEMPTWSLVGGFTNVYSSTYVGAETPVNVADMLQLDSYLRLGVQLIGRASIAQVDANPGSYFISGKTVYVKLADQRAPENTYTWVMCTGFNGVADNSAAQSRNDLYIENVKFAGGNIAFKSYNSNTDLYAFKQLVGVNCEFMFSYGTDGADIRGQTWSSFQYSICRQNMRDGFNYDAQSLKSPRAYEEWCQGYDNGRTNGGGGSDNGSTAHMSSQVIRCNGRYEYNDGRNVADIDSVISYNIACYAGKSVATDINAQAGFASGAPLSAGDTTKMWCINCTATGGTYGFQVNADDILNWFGGNFATSNNNIIGTAVAFRQDQVMTETTIEQQIAQATANQYNIVIGSVPGSHGIADIWAVQLWMTAQTLPDATAAVNYLNGHDVYWPISASRNAAAPINETDGPVRWTVENVGGGGTVGTWSVVFVFQGITNALNPAGAGSKTVFYGYVSGQQTIFTSKRFV